MRLLLFFIFLFSYFDIQAQKVYGTVFNDKGDILPFASVTVKNTTKGVSANEKGKFLFSLPNGKYTLVCQAIGYTASEKKVTIDGETELTFILKEQKLILEEVVVRTDREDPAYEIIRQAIAKRPYYRKEVKAFNCDLYAKDVLQLRKLPNKIFGQKIESSDRNDMGLDSAGKGIIYLSESISEVHSQEPDKFKLDVKSSRVSGSNSFGFTFPVFITLYDNNVTVFDRVFNPRGFVSPIADGALNYYKYKFLGTFWEDGKSVNAIRVTPRRAYEPLFTGIINITDDDWRIHSFDLWLTKKSQLEILDSLSINQLHVPVGDSGRMVKNQLLSFSFKMLGIEASGSFLSVYSNYELNPTFKKGYFDRVVIKYDTAVNKRSKEYWDTIRPMPLEPEEKLDYKVKDSLFIVEQELFDKQNIDSLRKKQGKIKPFSIINSGLQRTYYGKKSRFNWGVDPLIYNSNFNNAEGFNANISGYLEKKFKKVKSEIGVYPNFRYGFGNGHFNPSVTIEWKAGGLSKSNTLRRWNILLGGGRRVSQFNKENAIGELLNTGSTLLYGYNFMKTYENSFAMAGVSKKFESGLSISGGFLWEDRFPLNNINNYTLFQGDAALLTPNYPTEKLDEQFVAHQAFIISANVSFKPGQKYIQFPHSRVPIGSKYPTFNIRYSKGIKDILGSDVDFDKWLFTISDGLNLNLGGNFIYKLGAGGFLNRKKVFIQDYQHFNGNETWVASDYVGSFQVANYYENSTIEKFFTIGHVEHHFNGLLTNKIPVFKKLKWNLVAGANAFYVRKDNSYADFFFGLENIFKIFRLDWVASIHNGNWQNGVLRIGTGGLLGNGVKLRDSGRDKLRGASFSF